MGSHSAAKTIAIVGIIFAIIGILSASKLALLAPSWKLMKLGAEKYNQAQNVNPNERQMVEQFMSLGEKTLGNAPSWFWPTSIIMGTIGLIVNAFYGVASILLLNFKKRSYNRFRIAVILSIIYGLIRAGVAAMAGRLMGSSSTAIIGVIMDVCLLTFALRHANSFSESNPIS